MEIRRREGSAPILAWSPRPGPRSTNHSATSMAGRRTGPSERTKAPTPRAVVARTLSARPSGWVQPEAE